MHTNMINAILRTERMFPGTFAEVHERSWGTLFLASFVPDSYDGNHACITERTTDADGIAAEIKEFYTARNITPRVYYLSTDGDDPALRSALTAAGFKIGDEAGMEIYLQKEPSRIKSNPALHVRLVETDDAGLAQAIETVADLRTARIVEQRTRRDDSWFFVGELDGTPVSIALLERVESMCRVDEVHTTEAHRCNGYSRTVIHEMVGFYRRSGMREPLYLWPANETAARIYREAGFIKQDYRYCHWAAWVE